MDHDAWRERSADTRAASAPTVLPATIIACVIALLMAPFVPVGFLVLLPTTLIIEHHLSFRRAWRKELQHLMRLPADG